MASSKAKWILIVGAILLVMGLWVAAFVVAATTISGGAAGPRSWSEEVITEGTHGKIAIVPVIGEIFSDPDQIYFGASDENVVSMLDQALEDPDVNGVVLEVDSPGGGVVPSDIIYNKVREVREAGVPVVALMGDTAASGGYYVAAGADEIVANSSTITGSIGVIMFLPNLEGTAEKLGIRPVIFKSGPHKDILSPFREVSPDEAQIIQGIIDQAYNHFVESVASGRNMDVNRVRELADGRVYTGQQAKDLGLVDHLGDLNTAVARLDQLAAIDDPTVVRYFRERGFAESLLGVTGRVDPAKAIADEVGVTLTPGLKYLWLPG